MSRKDQLQLIRSRCERMISFCEFEAPDSIIGAEAELIRRAVFCLGEKAAAPYMTRQIEDAKRCAGMCAAEGCPEALPMSASTAKYCVVHAEALRLELRQIEVEMDEGEFPVGDGDSVTGCADDLLPEGHVQAVRQFLHRSRAR